MIRELIERRGCALYLADARQIAAELCRRRPDAVVTDPPYGLGHGDPGRARRPSNYRTRDGRDATDRRGGGEMAGNAEPPDIEWLLNGAWKKAIWGADHFRAQLPAGGRIDAWDKLDGRAGWDSYSDVEYVWLSQGGKSRIFRHLWKGLASSKKGGERPDGRRDHPTQKPVRAMSWCIEQLGLPAGSLVLDPYMGSGTTGLAARRAGCLFIGVEIDERWFRAAARRLGLDG